jgi:hypothetical protein
MRDVPPLTVTLDWAGGVARACVPGELDPLTCSQLRERLAWVAENRPQRLVLDLGGVGDGYLEQVITLIAVVRRQLPPGCLLDVRSASPALRSIAEIAGWAEVRVNAGQQNAEPTVSADSGNPDGHPTGP